MVDLLVITPVYPVRNANLTKRQSDHSTCRILVYKSHAASFRGLVSRVRPARCCGRMVYHSMRRLFLWSFGRLPDHRTHRPVLFPNGRSVVLSVGRLVVWHTGHLFFVSVIYLVEPSLHRCPDSSTVVMVVGFACKFVVGSYCLPVAGSVI